MNVYFNQGQRQYDDNSYSPTVGLDDRVITGGKVYPVLPNPPRDLPISPYTGQEYDPAWATPLKYETNPPKPKQRPQPDHELMYPTRPKATKAAYNAHWIDVPFVLAWMVWFTMLGLPTMVLAAGLTSGLPKEYGVVGMIVWLLLDIISSFIATYVSRKLHARKTSTRRYTGDRSIENHRWVDRRS